MANGRCRLHGGKCTGPRTAKGKAAFKAAHTKHGRTTAPKRAANLYTRTLAVRSYLTSEAQRLSAHLPADMAARLARGPDELWPPVHLSNQGNRISKLSQDPGQEGVAPGGSPEFFGQ
jgi:hypothetical protein